MTSSTVDLHSDPDFRGLGYFLAKYLGEFICSVWSRGRHSPASSQVNWSTVYQLKSGIKKDGENEEKESNILCVF